MAEGGWEEHTWQVEESGVMAMAEEVERRETNSCGSGGNRWNTPLRPAESKVKYKQKNTLKKKKAYE